LVKAQCARSDTGRENPEFDRFVFRLYQGQYKKSRGSIWLPDGKRIPELAAVPQNRNNDYFTIARIVSTGLAARHPVRTIVQSDFIALLGGSLERLRCEKGAFRNFVAAQQSGTQIRNGVGKKKYGLRSMMRLPMADGATSFVTQSAPRSLD